MSTGEPALKVKCGGKILGPMTIVDVANLLAEGRLAESDLVSESGGPWVSVERYVSGQAAEPAPAPSADALFAADFSIELDVKPAAPPPSDPPPPKKPRAMPPAARPAPPPPPPPPPEDYGPSPRVVPLSDEELLPIAHADMSPLEDLEDPTDDDEEDDATPYRLSGGPRAAPRDEPVAPPVPPVKPPSKKRPARTEVDPPRKPARGKPSRRIVDDPDDEGGELPDEDALLSIMQALAKEESQGRPPADSASRPRAVPLKRGELGTTPPANPPAKKAEASGPAIPPGARSLFNGRDLSGWEILKTDDASDEESGPVWSVRDGVIRYVGESPQPHLFSAADFANFELWIGWRCLEPDFQGGIFLRSDAHGGARTWISMSAKNAGRMLGADQSGSNESPALQKAAGEWNVWKIVAVGPRVGLWCNNQCAWSAAKIDRPSGRIGLRGDGSPFEVRFLHLRDVKRK